MHRLFGQLRAALTATAEIRTLARFRLPLAINTVDACRSTAPLRVESCRGHLVTVSANDDASPAVAAAGAGPEP